MRIALLTSGADVPGINAAIRMVVAAALARRHEPFGFTDGFDGLIDGRIAPLGLEDVDGITHCASSILGSSEASAIGVETWLEAAATVLREHEIEALVIIGGNSTLAAAHALAEASDCQAVVLPASNQNDVRVTRACLGADTTSGAVVGRPGRPSQADRVLAIRLGFEAVVAVEQGASDVLLGWDVADGLGHPTEDGRVSRVPLAEVLGRSRPTHALRLLKMAG